MTLIIFAIDFRDAAADAAPFRRQIISPTLRRRRCFQHFAAAFFAFSQFSFSPFRRRVFFAAITLH
jgi:hypothetical protein